MKFSANNFYQEYFKKNIVLVLVIILAFFISNYPISLFEYIFKLNLNLAIGIRQFIFFIAVILLFLPFKSLLVEFKVMFHDNKLLARSLLLFLSLLALVSTIKIASMGAEYGVISASPFNQDFGFYYRRLLMPAIVFFLQLGGAFGYNIFHFLLLFVNILLVIYLFLINDVRLKFWQQLSILTSGMIIFQFQIPGYTEQGVLFLALLFLCFKDKFTSGQRMSLIALMLLFHESAGMFMGIPLIVSFFPKNEKLINLSVMLLFVTFWLSAYSFNVKNLFITHTQLGQLNNIDYFIKNPLWVAGGVFFAYKALWFLLLFFIFSFVKQKKILELGVPILFICLPLLLISIVDVSRIVAWGYLGILLIICVLKDKLQQGKYQKVLLLNLLIPSIYVGSNTGPVSFPGAYQLIVLPIKFLLNFLR